ncbi:uncharacterized protein BO95DRAFT_446087 [Aspergillus brunneoviolaceus CBS 621.78]|uniref:Uncharacterized protein n=1 Tax=Aspergillus brunneoviolaceus CBS 621.78 TaxID=1450534 RepID=A0ACD1FZ97_9EURO|nr:hypothetical protein BO95DRAFT_446087 [Aspergillus brunneoviolaceus CBS 621.78]RAH42343.1 hypothetical protein BO95DRAFT_446087 [Aspergillus brunneoviolaceus CBS 621.78]
MARPFQPYEPELQKLSSNTESPMSPVPRGETPVSFKPNVNRAKTKRWVEAKKYSYDGNDWGDDEYGEYDDDEPPPVPQHNLNQSTGDLPSMFTRDVSRPPLPSMDRSRSMDQVATLGGDSVRAQPADPVQPATRTVPIVRPVDIYKRMRSEGAVPQDRSGAQSSAGPSNATTTATIPGLTSAELHFPSSNEAPAATGDYKPFRPQGAVDGGQDAQALQISHPAEAAEGGTPTIQLPDVERLSSFAPDFSGDSYFSTSEAQGPESEQHQLQHNPSMGFRSVVHQAFDVPDTPSTTVDSVARSNSDSTSVISPIIPQRSQSDIKTPTILEEPGERTPPPKDASDTLVFKPGHRRDISLPSPNNSPSRTPRITNVQSAHPSAAGEMSVETPVASSFNSQSGEQTPQEALVHDAAPGPDHPAPLSIGSHPVTSAPTLTHDGVPIIIPSMSTDNSPQDTESDRLRKEIMRTLSRETTPSKEQEEEEPASRPEAERQDSLIPSEYERYWSAAESTTSPIALDQATPDYVASPVALQGSTVQDLPPAASEPITSPATESPKPKLARRFSWESSSSSEEPAPVAGVQSPPDPMPGQFPVSRETPVLPSPAAEVTSPTAAEAIPAEAIPAQTVTCEEEPLNKTPEESDSSVGPETEKPKLTILPPVPDDRSTISDGQLPEVYHAEAIPHSYADTNQDNNAPAFFGEYNQHQQIPRWTPTAPASVEPTLLGFREILAMKTPEDRVQAFNDTRAKFATIDTGLAHWIQVTVHSHPEHADVVDKSAKLATGAVPPQLGAGAGGGVTRKKFPKLSSLGNFGSSSQLDVSAGGGAPSGSGISAGGHARRPSAPLGAMMNKQQVEQRGKELLHSAGVLGGRAGEAAKGLFARGRSKLKGGGIGGHSEKVDS